MPVSPTSPIPLAPLDFEESFDFCHNYFLDLRGEVDLWFTLNGHKILTAQEVEGSQIFALGEILETTFAVKNPSKNIIGKSLAQDLFDDLQQKIPEWEKRC